MDDIEVTKLYEYRIIQLDEDGTPMVYGERMVEVSEGVWKTKDLIEIEDYLRRMIPL